MDWLPWNRREKRLRDLDEEMETDLFFETRRRMEDGATPEEAKRAARKAFGNVTRGHSRNVGVRLAGEGCP